MGTPPVIGIPLHQRHDVAPFAKRMLEQQSQAYFHAVERGGGVPVGIPASDSEASVWLARLREIPDTAPDEQA